MNQNEFYVYENYVVYLHVYHVRSYSPTPTYKQTLYGCQPYQPQASLATTNRYNHVYVVLFFILLFMYAVIHCLYSIGNKITTTTTIKTFLLIDIILKIISAQFKQFHAGANEWTIPASTLHQTTTELWSLWGQSTDTEIAVLN